MKGTAKNLITTTHLVNNFNVIRAKVSMVTVNVAFDRANNKNNVATQFSVDTDSTNPTSVLTGPSGLVTGAL